VIHGGTFTHMWYRHYVAPERRRQTTTPNHFASRGYGVPSREALALLVEEGGIRFPKGPPRSSLFFDCNVLHGPAGNPSPFPRAGLFIVYNSVENGVVVPFGGRLPRPIFLAERKIVPA